MNSRQFSGPQEREKKGRLVGDSARCWVGRRRATLGQVRPHLPEAQLHWAHEAQRGLIRVCVSCDTWGPHLRLQCIHRASTGESFGAQCLLGRGGSRAGEQEVSNCEAAQSLAQSYGNPELEGLWELAPVKPDSWASAPTSDRMRPLPGSRGRRTEVSPTWQGQVPESQLWALSSHTLGPQGKEGLHPEGESWEVHLLHCLDSGGLPLF